MCLQMPQQSITRYIWNSFTRNMTSSNVNNLWPSSYTHKISEFFIIFTEDTIWDKLPISVKLAKSFLTFKLKFKRFLIL